MDKEAADIVYIVVDRIYSSRLACVVAYIEAAYIEAAVSRRPPHRGGRQLCVCVRVCVCVCVCLYMYIYIYIYIDIYIFTYVYIGDHMEEEGQQLCVCVCLFVCVPIINIHIYMYIYICIYMRRPHRGGGRRGHLPRHSTGREQSAVHPGHQHTSPHCPLPALVPE